VRRVAVGLDVLEPVLADPVARRVLVVDTRFTVTVDQQLVSPS